MTTTDTVLVIILTVLLSLFLILCIAVMTVTLKILTGVKRVVAKAEDVADSVESAAEVLRDTSGRLAFFKLIRNIVNLAQKQKGSKKS